MSIVGILKSNEKIQQELVVEFELAIQQDRISVADTLVEYIKDERKVRNIVTQRVNLLYEQFNAERQLRKDFKHDYGVYHVITSCWEEMSNLSSTFQVNYHMTIFRELEKLINKHYNSS